MQVSSAFKTAFLHLMLQGLNEAHSKNMSFQERKNMIKMSADSAMARARGEKVSWSHAIIAGTSKTRRISKNILKRYRKKIKKKNVGEVSSAAVARRLVKKRSKLLKKLIPGGESLNSLSLLSENAVDYVVHLQAQVNLMQCLASALGSSNLKDHKVSHQIEESGLDNCCSKIN